jgi:lipoprotein NlpD
MTTDKNNMLTTSKRASAAFFCAALMAACSSTSNRAPVEDRMAVRPPAAAASAAVPITTEPTKPLPGAENAGKPGYYAVKPGDTLIRIGLDNGQSWKDLVKWNNFDNPNIIEVGQVIRVLPPGVDPNSATVKPVTTAKVETKPLDGKAATPAASASAPAGAVAPAPTAAAGPREPEDDVNWMWPASGAVIAPFDDGKSKGLDIGGKAGEPVYAAADGRVMYAGSGLRGYGNLIILKHNNTYLTAYAHNRALLVKDEQAVKRGQKIAEMGSTDAEGVRLHFEIRKQGKPIDPARLLPPR